MEQGKTIITETPQPIEAQKKEKTKREIMQRKKFIKAYLEHGTATKAYMQVFKVKEKSAGVLGSLYLKGISIEEILEEGGLTDAVIVEQIKQGLQSTRPYGKDNYLHADNTARHNYLDTLIRLKHRQLDKDKQPQQMQGIQIIIEK